MMLSDASVRAVIPHGDRLLSRNSVRITPSQTKTPPMRLHKGRQVAVPPWFTVIDCLWMLCNGSARCRLGTLVEAVCSISAPAPLAAGTVLSVWRTAGSAILRHGFPRYCFIQDYTSTSRRICQSSGRKKFCPPAGSIRVAEGLFGTLHKNKGESSENAPGDCIKC